MESQQDRFAQVVASFSGVPGVTPPTETGRFGGNSLKINGSIFAMVASAGDFVLKLPKNRVDALVAAGKGERFDPRRNGKVMKEWVIIHPQFSREWASLAAEAMRFVAVK